MHSKLVHEEGKRPLYMPSTKQLQVFNELFGSDSVVVDWYCTEAVLLRHWGDHRAITCVDICLIDREIGILLWPLSCENGALGEVDFVEKHYLSVVLLCDAEFFEKILAVDREFLLCVLRHILLLSHLLSLDSVLQIKSPQAGYCNPLVSEMPMEKNCSKFERKACPFLQSIIARQEVNMMLLELEGLSLASWLLCVSQSTTTNILHCVVRNT